ncbi:CinA family protein [Klugiella xanthotipulae]
MAESLTGGLLVGELVSVPGASAVVSGGIVAYDTELKRSLLGVSRVLLGEYGPVHPEVARQMAAGVRRTCAVSGQYAGVGIATTGVAGPDPDPATGQPAGVVFVGLSSERGERHVEFRFEGDRQQIRVATVGAALGLLREELVHLLSAKIR